MCKALIVTAFVLAGCASQNAIVDGTFEVLARGEILMEVMGKGRITVELDNRSLTPVTFAFREGDEERPGEPRDLPGGGSFRRASRGRKLFTFQNAASTPCIVHYAVSGSGTVVVSTRPPH